MLKSEIARNHIIVYCNDEKELSRYLEPYKEITRSEYEKMFGISERTANRELSDLVKLSIFNKIGKGPNIYYELTKISPNIAKKMIDFTLEYEHTIHHS